jgi:hypothetical protein
VKYVIVNLLGFVTVDVVGTGGKKEEKRNDTKNIMLWDL